MQLLKVLATGLFGLVLFTACKTSPVSAVKRTGATSSASSSLASMEASILAEVNRHRKSKGLPALQSNSFIETEASLHSQRMASRQVAFGHGGYETRVSRLTKRLGGISASAENVAYGSMNAREVVQGWLKSPPHRKNIEGRYNLTGIGVSRNSRGVIFFTQLFLLK